jgi:hypothetical protein
MLHTIGDFWSSTENFMESDTRPWTTRANDPLAHTDLEKNQTWAVSQNQSIISEYVFSPEILDQPDGAMTNWEINTKNQEKSKNNLATPMGKRCRLVCIICIAIQDVGMTLLTNNAILGAVWSAIARCCVCNRCGAVGCQGD